MSLPEKDNFIYEKLSRREIRSLIFHLIYAAECLDYTASIESIVDNFNRGMDLDIPVDSEAVKLANLIVEKRAELDKSIEPLLDNWRLERIGVCTKLILRIAMWEIENTDIPASIVINEAIELAKCFSEKDSYRFVNGILDEVCKDDESLCVDDNSGAKKLTSSDQDHGIIPDKEETVPDKKKVKKPKTKIKTETKKSKK